MKKSLWMFAAMTCGLALTSCEQTDNPVVTPDVPSVEPTSVVIDFEDEDISMFQIADEARMKATVVDDEATGSKVAQFVRSNSSGIGFASYSMLDLEDATKVSVALDFNIPAEILAPSAITIGDATVHNTTFGINDGQYGYTDNGAIFYLGATRGKLNGNNQNYFFINGECVATPDGVDVEGVEVKTSTIWGNWFHLDLTVDVANRLVSYTVKNGEEVVFEGTDVPFISDNALACTQIDIQSGNNGTYLIDNIVVKKLASDASIKYADYTISYVDTEGAPLPEELKTTITRRGKIGEAITLLDADKANFINADGSLKYTYQSDNAEGATVTAAGTEIKIVYAIEEMPKFKFRLSMRTDGGALLGNIEEEAYEAKIPTIFYPLAFKSEADGKFYVTPVTGDTKYQGRFYTFKADDFFEAAGYYMHTVTYTVVDSLDFIADFEDETMIEVVGEVANMAGKVIVGNTKNETYPIDYSSWNVTADPKGLFDRFSNGRCVKLTEGSYAMTKEPLAGGTYKVYIFGRNDGNSDNEIKLGYVDATGELHELEIAVPIWGGGATAGVTLEGVEIPAGCKLAVINKGDANQLSLDLISITSKYTPTAAE